MKTIILTIATFLTINLTAQVNEDKNIFKYSKVISMDQFLKIKGDIVFSDSVITINTKGQEPVNLKVNKLIDTELTKQYKTKEGESRLTLSLTNGFECFTYEIKDAFTGNVLTVVYLK